MTDGLPGKRRSLKSGWYAAVAVLTALFCWRFVFAADGPRQILKLACAGGGSIDLALSVYPHPFDFELGGSIGYKLTYNTEAGESEPIYDNNFSSTDRHGSVSAPFVSWRFDGERFSEPYPSYTYAPLPRNGTVRVFKSEAQVGFVPKPKSLEFMNVFLDTRRISQAQFAIIADCLAAHEHDLDRALARMQNSIPSSLSRFYYPLRLGGIFYGPPPYTDPSYMQAVKDQLSASNIPEIGGFRLFRGRSTTGVINGHQIGLFLTDDGEIQVRREGALVSFDKRGKGDQPGISRSDWNIYVDAGQCADQKTDCGELIQMIGQRDDMSDWFLIFRQLGPRTWGQTAVPSPFQP